MKQLGILASLFLISSVVSARSIVSICFAPDDKALEASCKSFRAKLTECRFDVIAVDDLDELKINNAVSKAISDDPDAHVFIDSHGIESSGNFFFSNVTKTIQISKKSVFDALYAKNREVPTWIDTCHAGACFEGTKACFGMSCARDQKAAMQAPIRDGLADLLCSSNGDCALWKKADRNPYDGVLSAEELNTFFLSPNYSNPEFQIEPRRKSLRISEEDKVGPKPAAVFIYKDGTRNQQTPIFSGFYLKAPRCKISGASGVSNQPSDGKSESKDHD
jgi:hypothetical protein